jgi:hypothetical protein
MNAASAKESVRGSSASEVLAGSGPAAAAILATAVGCFELAILAILADASKSVAGWMIFYHPTGPLSGVTLTAIVLWLVTWWVLAMRWRTKPVSLGRASMWAVLLLVLALLITFPPIEHVLLGR